MNPLEIDFLGVKFKNPVLAASGTYGFGLDYKRYYDPARLGGFCTKGLTLEPRNGNTGIRLWETPQGILNSIGLENPGIDVFIDSIYPEISKIDTNIIVNVGGKDEYSYLKALEKLNCFSDLLVELNISCPNVKAGGMAFGMDAAAAGDLVKKAKEVSDSKLIVKLSPNAGDLVGVAKACEENGADALSLINTIQGMAIDYRKRKIVFDNTYAGLSGPAVKPIALRMVHQVAKNTSIPIIGLGGISTWEDVLEFMMAGASLVQVGTMNFVYPQVPLQIIDGLEKYCYEENERLENLIGIL